MALGSTPKEFVKVHVFLVGLDKARTEVVESKGIKSDQDASQLVAGAAQMLGERLHKD